jgi:Transcriptional regulators
MRIVAPNASTPPTDLLSSLRQRILSGQYPAGSWLPTERELAAEFGLPRRAVRRAIARLAEEGMVRCQPRFRPVVESVRTAPHVPGVAASRLVALVMWHGDPEERGATAQQRIFWGMNRRLARDGFHGVFLDLGDSVRSEEENAEREAAHLNYAREQGFAGVVFYPYAYRRNRELIRETARALPLVLIDRMVPGVQADYVGVDNQGAVREAVRHLIDRGHRRILFATTAEAVNTVQDRWEGYRSAMAEAPGGPLPESVFTLPTDPPLSATPPVFATLFGLGPERRPTAVVCVNDFVALDIYRHLRDLNLRVPDDVALCGFDDVIPELPGGVGLTTLAQPFEEIGSAAAEVFLSRHAAGGADLSAPVHVELPARLVRRDSSGGAMARARVPAVVP